MIIRLMKTADLLKMCEDRSRLRAELEVGPVARSILADGYIIDTEKSHMIRVREGMLVDGERRVRAAALLGIGWLPVEMSCVSEATANVTSGHVGIPDDAPDERAEPKEIALDLLEEVIGIVDINWLPSEDQDAWRRIIDTCAKFRNRPQS